MKELVDPTTGEIIPEDDTDGLIAALDRVSQQQKQLSDFRSEVATVFLDRVKDMSGKTRRLSGRNLRVKLTMPDDKWDQAALKLAWKSYPEIARRCMGIDRVRVMLREWKKVQNEVGIDQFEEFKAAITKANLGPQGMPSIVIESSSEPVEDLPILDDLPTDGGAE